MLHIDRCFAGPVNIDVSPEVGTFTRSSSAESDWGASGGKRGSGGYLGSMSASMLRSRSQSLLPITNQPLTKSPGASFSVRRSHRRSTCFKPAMALLVLCILSGATYIYTRPSPALSGSLPVAAISGGEGAAIDLSEAEHRRRGGVVDDSHLDSYHHHQTAMGDDKLRHKEVADHQQLGQQEKQQQQHVVQREKEAVAAAVARVEPVEKDVHHQAVAGAATQQQAAVQAGEATQEQQEEHAAAAAQVDAAAALDHAEVGAEEAQQQALEKLEEIHQQLGGTAGDAAAAAGAGAAQQQQQAEAGVQQQEQQQAEAEAAQQQAEAAQQQQEVVSAEEAQQAEQAHLAEQAAHQAALEAQHQAALQAQHVTALEQQQSAHDQGILEAQHAAHAAAAAQKGQHADAAQHLAGEQAAGEHAAAEAAAHAGQAHEQVVPAPRQPPSLYDAGLSALDIHGNVINLADLHGRASIILNVASHCGYTQTNYVQLQQIYERYQMYGLEILGFPCNQFGAQEPGTNAEILSFVQTNFHVSFPMMSKVDVNGEHASPIFQFLKQHTPPMPGHPPNEDISWNFNKFLVDKWGHPVKRYGPDLIQYELETDVYNELIKVYGNEQHLQQ